MAFLSLKHNYIFTAKKGFTALIMSGFVFFKDLIERGVAPIYLRLFLFIYKEQRCDVRWNGKFSSRFPVSNGCRQGSVVSPIFFSIYIDKLIKKLQNLSIGCTILGVYYGIIVYADDIFLLSPTREGLQTLLNICQDFASKRNLKFSVSEDIEKSKTKCIIFTKRKMNKYNTIPIYLDGKPLKYVDKLNHLGNMLQSDNSMKIDISRKRTKFIGKVNSLNQELYFSSPDVRAKFYSIYCCNFYSSSIWDLFNRGCDKLYKSFNVAIRICFNLPWNTHRYLIEELIDFPHPKIMLCSRFVNFHLSVKNSKKSSIRLLSHLSLLDDKTIYKNNLVQIARECKVKTSELNPAIVKSEMRYSEVPDDESWRVPLLHNLLSIRAKEWSLENFGSKEINDMVYDVCAN